MWTKHREFTSSAQVEHKTAQSNFDAEAKANEAAVKAMVNPLLEPIGPRHMALAKKYITLNSLAHAVVAQHSRCPRREQEMQAAVDALKAELDKTLPLRPQHY